MTENARKFFVLASNNEALRKKTASLPPLNTREGINSLISLAASLGFTFTAQDLEPQPPAKITEDELKAVAGGDFMRNCSYSGKSTDQNISSCVCTSSASGVSKNVNNWQYSKTMTLNF